MLQFSVTRRLPERTLVKRVCDEMAALSSTRVWARADGRHVLLGLNAGEPFARLTSLGGDSYGLAFPGADGRKWELLLIDDLAAVVEHALIGAESLSGD